MKTKKSEELIKRLSLWKKNRETIIIPAIKLIIEKLHRVQKDVDISKILGDSVSLVGTSFAILGTVLAPITAGTSLVFAAGGAIVAGAGSLTSIGASVANAAILQSELKKCQELVDEDRQLLRDISDLLNDKAVVDEALKMVDFGGRAVANLIKNVSTNLPKIIANATIVLNLLGAVLTIKSLIDASKSDVAKNLAKKVKEMENDLRTNEE